MTANLVKNYYTGYVRREWRRLVKDAYHRLEFETTLHFLTKYLPERGLVLDAGGGPGRYTIELARLGFDVVLLDLTPANLDFARQRIRRIPEWKNVKALVEGSITDLSQFADGTFDAVICTGGPLSHVVDADQRQRAISELVRVAKPGAPIFASVMTRLGVLAFMLEMSQVEVEMPHFKTLLETGDYMGEHGFTLCHFFLLDELKQAFSEQPVEVLEMVGLEGIGANHRKKMLQLARNPERWQAWKAMHFTTCAYPSVAANSEHMMIVCRKR